MSTDQLETLVLARARDGLRPSEQRRTRLLESIAANGGRVSTEPLAPCPDPPSQVVVGSTLRALLNGSGRLTFTSRAVAAALVLGAAAGFGGAQLLGAVHSSALVQATQPAEHVADSVPAPRNNGVESARRPLGAQSLGEATTTKLSPVDLAALPHESNAAESKRGVGQAKVQRGGANADAEVSFYEELSYLRRAQAALRDGQSAMALGLMETLDSMPSKGALWAERNMTKVLALCQLGRAEEATAIATRVAQADTGQVYRKRLEASCAGATEVSPPKRK